MTRFVGNPLRGTNFSAAGDEAISARVNGDSVARFRVDAGGRLTWSDGTNAGDTILYRDSADLLKTDDVFQSSAGIVTLTTSGTPTTSLADGAIAIDTTNDKLFFRSSSAWTEVSGGGANVTISDTAPSSPEAGDLWFDSTSGDIYIYYGSQWVDVGGDSVANIAVQSTAPSSPVNGDLWFDTDNGNTYLYYDDGTSGQWVGVGSFPNPFPNDVVFEQNAEVEGTLTANHIHGNIAGSVYLHVKNTSGVTIPAGSPVYATGSVGASGATEVAISDADNASTMPALGIVDSELVPNAEGHATVLGVAKHLNTGSYSVNDSLYVSTTGGLTNTRPTGASELVQKIGRVVRSDASTGEILVLGAGRTNDVPNNIVAGGLTIDTDTLHVDATNDRVGIGVDSPAGKLTINHDNTDGVVDFTDGLMFTNNAGGGATEWSHAGIVSTGSSGFNGNLVFGTDGDSTANTSGVVERMRIDSSGNVGIGTTSPQRILDIQGASNPEIRLQSTDSTDPFLYFGDQVDAVRGGIGYDVSADALQLRGYNNNTRMTIDSSGNVGIGTSSPPEKLTVDNGIIHARSGSSGPTTPPTDKGVALTAVGMNTSSKYTPGILFGSRDPQFTTTNPKYNAGIYGVATETYGNDSDTAMQIEFLTSGTNGGTGHGVGLGTGYRMGPVSFYPLVDNTCDLGGSSSGLRWDDIFATSGTVNTSDQRDKANITNLDLGLTFVDSLRPVSYTWADRSGYVGSRTHMGFVAQEVATALGDEAVNRGLWINSPSVPIDPEDPEGEQTDERQGLRYHQLIAPMVKAIQELSATVQTLTARIEALEAG